MTEVLREQTVGDLLEQTFSLTFRYLGKLFLIQLVIALPIHLMFEAIQGADTNPEDMIPLCLVALVPVFFLSPLPGAACIVALSGAFTGHHRGVAACYGAVLPYLVRLILLGIVVTLLLGLGFGLCILPGIMLMLIFFVSTQALLLEELSVGKAMGRSAELTRGHRWRLLAFSFCLGLLLIILAVASFFVQIAVVVAAPNAVGTILSSGIQLLVNTFCNVLQACAGVAAYFDLRVRKDAFHLEQLADVVDRISPPEA